MFHDFNLKLYETKNLNILTKTIITVIKNKNLSQYMKKILPNNSFSNVEKPLIKSFCFSMKKKSF
jgi:hypothetical protein